MSYNNDIKPYRIKCFNNNVKEVLFPGDKVEIDNNYITAVQTREHILYRMVEDNSKACTHANKHIIACNIDLALIVVSPQTPEIHPKFIDRYLILLNRLQIPASIIINKCDLIDERTIKILEIYENMGIRIYKTSAISNTGVEELKKDVMNKQIILLGQSGVGKTTLTNRLCNQDNRTGKVGDKTKRGRHTTTSSENNFIDESTMIIDTPGIRSISLKNITKKDIIEYFNEIESYGRNCKFTNCSHINENKEYCMVKQAVDKGEILKSRYESYLKLINEIKK